MTVCLLTAIKSEFNTFENAQEHPNQLIQWNILDAPDVPEKPFISYKYIVLTSMYPNTFSYIVP